MTFCLRPYVTERERTTWFKIKNRSYSQMQGREELFERERHRNLYPAGIVVNWLVSSWNSVPAKSRNGENGEQ